MHYNMNERTSILLDRPLLVRIRREARKGGQTLTETIRALLLAGLAKKSRRAEKHTPLPSYSMGRELADLTSRSRLYEIWDREK